MNNFSNKPYLAGLTVSDIIEQDCNEDGVHKYRIPVFEPRGLSISIIDDDHRDRLIIEALSDGAYCQDYYFQARYPVTRSEAASSGIAYIIMIIYQDYMNYHKSLDMVWGDGFNL